MCGIALEFSPGRKARSMPLEKLRHRGPDSQGEWRSNDGACWLGHTRLAILDLSENGAQPMCDPETGNAIIFNGEIYNHLALRGRLREPSHRWRGGSDTETLLAGYRRSGRELPSRLKGMFAFAIYDAGSRSVFVARDRFGMKPVYYTWQNGILTLASELRVLLGDRAPSFTPESVSAYLHCGACPDEHLLWPEVQSLRPGHSLEVTAEGRISTRSFWNAPQCPAKAYADPGARVRELLEYSVEDHLQADVPIASFLSGGIDSSIITALAAQKLSRPLHTFSVGFRQQHFDETAVAKQIAERYGTEHERIELSEEEIISLVREAVTRFDLPSVDAINTYIVASVVARRGIKVALTGLGGDELFGGYPVFREIKKLQWLGRLPAWTRSMFALGGERGRRMIELPANDPALLTRWRRRFMTEAEARAAGLPIVPLNGVHQPAALPDDFAQVSWAELTGYTRDMLLRDADQMSMAVSLELRIPFLDHELVEYLLHLPARYKQAWGGTKGLLTRACRDLIPESVYRRPKMGFGLPMAEWMRGPLESFVTEGLEEVRARNILRPDYLTRLMGRFKIGAVHWTRLWSVVVLGHYLRNTQGQMALAAQVSRDFSPATPPASEFLDAVSLANCP